MPVIVRNNPKVFCLLDEATISLNQFECGISAEVIQENRGEESPVKKSLGAIVYDDFVFETGLNNKLIEIIKRAWKGDNAKLNGSFVTTDDRLNSTYEDIFLDSLLTETTISECDGASKEGASFGFKIKPALTHTQKGDGRQLSIPKNQLQKSTLLKSNFRFELGKLPCSRIVKIDAFTVTTKLNSESKGANRYVEMTPTAVEFPNLHLTISSVDLQAWLDWHKQCVIDGKNNPANEHDGRLVFLDRNLKDEIFSINLKGVGIFSLKRKLETADKLTTFRVGLYCETMEIVSKEK
jgi:hypothetical protein